MSREPAGQARVTSALPAQLLEGNAAYPLLTEAFRQRLRGIRGPEVLVPYEYDRWEITGQEVAPDSGAVAFKGKAGVTFWRKYQDIGPGSRADDRNPSGGQADFSLRLAKGKGGAWAVDDFRFEKRSCPTNFPCRSHAGGGEGSSVFDAATSASDPR